MYNKIVSRKGIIMRTYNGKFGTKTFGKFCGIIIRRRGVRLRRDDDKEDEKVN